jgi:hypothetical protein
VEIDRPLHSGLAVIGGHIGRALEDLGGTIQRATMVHVTSSETFPK